MESPLAHAQGDTMRLKQFIAPIECTEEVIDDGVTTTQILTPEECDELLHPTPPDTGGGETEHPETPSSPSKKPTRPSDSGDLNAPNTGWLRRANDAVREAGVVPLLVIIGALLLIKKIRKYKG